MANEILKGSDADIRITLTDPVTKAAIDLSALEGILVFLYYKDNAQVLAQYSLNSRAGFDDVTIIDGPGGILQVKLQSATTAAAKEGEILAEVKTELTDAGYTDDEFHSAASDAPVGFIKKALSKDQSGL